MFHLLLPKKRYLHVWYRCHEFYIFTSFSFSYFKEEFLLGHTNISTPRLGFAFMIQFRLTADRHRDRQTHRQTHRHTDTQTYPHKAPQVAHRRIHIHYDSIWWGICIPDLIHILQYMLSRIQRPPEGQDTVQDMSPVYVA